MELTILQHYWWIIISVLGGILVFLLFIQGGQGLLDVLGKSKEEKDLVIQALGSKWEFTFTTLVVFGGAFFASFPLFYATSFGGAYLVWMLILFSFVLQAVSYEYRKKPNNFLGQRTYEVFLIINGYVAPFLLGAAVATFFTGSPFKLGEMMEVKWMTPWRGLDALFVFTNYTLAFAVLFLVRTNSCLYIIHTVEHTGIEIRCRRQLRYDALLFVLFFLLFLGLLFSGEGYGINASGGIERMAYKYFYNMVEMPLNGIIFLLGVAAVLTGILKTLLDVSWRKGIWFSGAGTILTVIALFIIAGFNRTSFYPSSADIGSSLTIYNASSSAYTLKAMSYVSVIIPFVIAYIWYAWRALTRKPAGAGRTEQEY